MYLILTTTKKPEYIANNLIKDKYAACVSYYKITSVYRWNEEITQDQEYMMIIKTARLRRTLNKIRELHDYELPEIVYYKVKASKSYLDWVRKNS